MKLFAILLGICSLLLGQDCGQFETSVDIPLGAAKMAISGNYAYIATGGVPALRVLDISDPTSPTELPNPPYLHNGFCFGSPISRDIAIEGNYAYLSYYCNSSLRIEYIGFFVLDISDPNNVVQLGDYYVALPDWEGGLAIKGDYVFLGAGPLGVQIVDVADKLHPYLVSSYETSGLPSAIVLHNDLAFIADDDSGQDEGAGLYILDISIPTSPHELSTLEVQGKVQSLTTDGAFVYLASGDSGFYVIDISQPAMPHPIAEMADIIYITDIEVFNHNLLVSGYERSSNMGLFAIYDAMNPANPKRRYSYHTSQQMPYDAALYNGYVYLSIFNSNLDVIDVHNCINYEQAMLPIVSSAHGEYGTTWKTDVVFHNPTSVEISGSIIYLQSGMDNSNAVGLPLTVAANSSHKICDIVESFFNKPDTFGAVRIESRGKLIVSSRTYNDLGNSGTYGQYVPGYGIEKAISARNEGRLIQLVQNASFRTNIGFANSSVTSLIAQIDLYKGTGEHIGSQTFTVLPYGHIQENSIIASITSDDIDDAYAIITSSNTDAAYFAYASVVDNRTGDGIYIPATRLE